MPATALRPLGIGETLDAAIKLSIAHAATLAKIVLVVVAPVTAVTVLVDASAPGDPNDVLQVDPITGELTTGDELWTFGAALGVSTLLALLASVLATGACFKAVADVYLGQTLDWRSSLRFAARRLGSILWLTFLTGLFVVLGTLLCVLPGIWLYFAFVAAMPALLTEGVRGRRALRRSRLLVKGRWWSVFATIVVAVILAGIVQGALVGVATIVVGTSTSTIGGSIASFVAQTLAATLTTPFTAAVTIVVYFDLRVRKEAFDLELLAHQLGVDPPAGAARAPIALTADPGRPPTDGSQPPFWPPPPGWRPPDEPQGDEGAEVERGP